MPTCQQCRHSGRVCRRLGNSSGHGNRRRKELDLVDTDNNGLRHPPGQPVAHPATGEPEELRRQDYTGGKAAETPEKNPGDGKRSELAGIPVGNCKTIASTVVESTLSADSLGETSVEGDADLSSRCSVSMDPEASTGKVRYIPPLIFIVADVLAEKRR
jgi:hypothetical protein